MRCSLLLSARCPVACFLCLFCVLICVCCQILLRVSVYIPAPLIALGVSTALSMTVLSGVGLVRVIDKYVCFVCVLFLSFLVVFIVFLLQIRRASCKPHQIYTTSDPALQSGHRMGHYVARCCDSVRLRRGVSPVLAYGRSPRTQHASALQPKQGVVGPGLGQRDLPLDEWLSAHGRAGENRN